MLDALHETLLILLRGQVLLHFFLSLLLLLYLVGNPTAVAAVDELLYIYK